MKTDTLKWVEKGTSTRIIRIKWSVLLTQSRSFIIKTKSLYNIRYYISNINLILYKLYN